MRPFAVFAASAAEGFPFADVLVPHQAGSAAMGKVFIFENSAARMTPAKAGGMGGENHAFTTLHATFDKYLDLSFIIRSKDFIPLAFMEEDRF